MGRQRKQMSSVGRGRVVLRASGDGRFEVWAVEGDLAVGFVEYRVGDGAEGWLTIVDIELEEGSRGWGYGSEAVRMVEEEAVRRGWARRFRAEVEARNGLGVYFWLRLGYRPGEGESGLAGTLVMVRTP